MRSYILLGTLLACCMFTFDANAQSVERNRPDEWKDLVHGARFMDRFLPMPVQGQLTSEAWGADNVKPRYIDNGIEDKAWSYWGGCYGVPKMPKVNETDRRRLMSAHSTALK